MFEVPEKQDGIDFVLTQRDESAAAMVRAYMAKLQREREASKKEGRE